MYVPREIQTELDRLKTLLESAQVADSTGKGEAEVERIRDRIEAKLEEQRELELRRIVAIAHGQNDLIPLGMLVESASIEAHKVQLQESKKDLAAYSSGRTFIRAAKRAIAAGQLTLREEGLGIPIEPSYVSAWCCEDETLSPLEKMMPRSDVMVRVSEARAWLESIGARIPAWLLAYGTRTKVNDELRQAVHPPHSPSSASVMTFKTPEERQDWFFARVEELGGTAKAGVTARVAKEGGIGIATARDLIAKGKSRAEAKRTQQFTIGDQAAALGGPKPARRT